MSKEGIKKIFKTTGTLLLFHAAIGGIVLMMCESTDMTTQYITSAIGAVLFLIGAIPAIVITRRSGL